MCIFSMTLRMTSTGQGDPAIMPVYSEVRLTVGNWSWFSMSMNIVGTPYSAVHLFTYTVASVHGLCPSADKPLHLHSFL